MRIEAISERVDDEERGRPDKHERTNADRRYRSVSVAGICRRIDASGRWFRAEDRWGRMPQRRRSGRVQSVEKTRASRVAARIKNE